MWINDKATYASEVITVTKGSPQRATEKAVGLDGKVKLEMPDGTEARVEARLCEAAHA